MLQHIKISTKLFFISLLSVAGLFTLSYIAIHSSMIGRDSLETIYEQNVVPNRDILEARHSFEMILNDLIHVTSEFLPTGQAKERLPQIEQTMTAFFENALKNPFYADPFLKKNLQEAYERYSQKIIPKYSKIRELYTKDNREELFRYIWGILKNHKCHLYRIGGVEDHIHIITHIHPSIAVSMLVKDLKLASSDYIKKQKLFPDFKAWQTKAGRKEQEGGYGQEMQRSGACAAREAPRRPPSQDRRCI